MQFGAIMSIRCNSVQLTKLLRMTRNVEICENHKKVQLAAIRCKRCNLVYTSIALNIYRPSHPNTCDSHVV